MIHDLQKIGKLEEPKRILSWLVFNQTRRDNFVVLFNLPYEKFSLNYLENEFGINRLDFCSSKSEGKNQKRCLGYLIREEDANLLRLMKPENLVFCDSVDEIIKYFEIN